MLGSRSLEESIWPGKGHRHSASRGSYGRASDADTPCTVLFLRPVLSVPVGVLARTLWEQSRGWHTISRFRASQRSRQVAVSFNKHIFHLNQQGRVLLFAIKNLDCYNR